MAEYNRKVTEGKVREEGAEEEKIKIAKEMLKENMQVPYSFAPAHLSKQRAGAVGALGEKYYREGKTVTAAEHQPEYLRVSQAERERAEREAGKK